MITRWHIDWRKAVTIYWKAGLVMSAYAPAIVLMKKQGLGADVPIAVPALVATAISILLGFRTSAAYDRWWEARKIWGAIVNDARTLARQVIAYIRDADETCDAMVRRQAAWCHALRGALRGEDVDEELRSLLDERELDELRTRRHRPGALLQTQSEELMRARRDELIDPVLALAVEGTLKRFSDHMGMCERIKTTVFPTPYNYSMSLAVWLFILLLPSSLAPYLGWFTVPVTLVVSFIFLMIEGIGHFLEDPFEGRTTDTPMTAICRTIEINLREMLGDADLPPKLEPVQGVLM